MVHRSFTSIMIQKTDIIMLFVNHELVNIRTYNKRQSMMDDKERIEYIIRQKHLTNVIFCAKTNIAPASLSHITSGRSKPTLAILRSIVQGFPDLNPEWVMMGTGDMYKSGTVSENEATVSDENGLATETSYGDETKNNGFVFGNEVAQSKASEVGKTRMSDGAFTQDIFGNLNNSESSKPKGVTVQKDVPNFNFPTSRQNPQNGQKEHSLTDIISETVSFMQKPQRKVVEVRIFYDDGTYEAFGPAKK